MFRNPGIHELTLTGLFGEGPEAAAVKAAREACGWDLQVAPTLRRFDPPTAEELVAKMTEQVEAKEAQNAPPAPPSEAPAATTEATPGTFDPELSPWVARVRIFVRANWSGASVCRGVPEFDVDVDAGGQLSHIALTKSSGDSYCDDTAERALRKSNPLPPPPHAVSFTFNLNPKDTP